MGTLLEHVHGQTIRQVPLGELLLKFLISFWGSEECLIGITEDVYVGFTEFHLLSPIHTQRGIRGPI